ncbi:MAG: DNA-3-methyladenine glycosylase 2 family protein [Candidatus Nanoarchaeia archaeon]
MKEAVANHFKKTDRILYDVMQKVGPIESLKPRSPDLYFQSLCREIIGQQLNSKVSKTIFKRFTNLFPKQNITPSRVLKLPGKKIRAVGMAWSKVEAIKDLARNTVEGKLDLENLKNLSDDQVTNELTKVKGIGSWTAQMFLMFTLGREDVFSNKDLGLQKAIRKLYKIEPTPEKLELLAEKWSPYKTYA